MNIWMHRFSFNYMWHTDLSILLCITLWKCLQLLVAACIHGIQTHFDDAVAMHLPKLTALIYLLSTLGSSIDCAHRRVRVTWGNVMIGYTAIPIFPMSIAMSHFAVPWFSTQYNTTQHNTSSRNIKFATQAGVCHSKSVTATADPSLHNTLAASQPYQSAGHGCVLSGTILTGSKPCRGSLGIAGDLVY